MRVTWLLAVLCGFGAGLRVTNVECDASSSVVPGTCVCELSAEDDNVVFCDNMDSAHFHYSNASNAIVFTTSESGKRFVRTEMERREGAMSGVRSWVWGNVEIEIDLEQSYQTLLGFGGAFTDAVGINLQKMNPTISEAILEGYYGSSGIGYSIGRIPIASCDFSTSNYTYDDVKGDYDLLHFTTSMDLENKVPTIKKAMQLYSGNHLESIKFFATPWSPPFWMKDNNNSVSGHLIFNDQNNKTYHSWVNYIIKFISEYQQSYQVPIWGITVQNEPVFSVIWQSMLFDAKSQRIFIADFLGPALKSAFPDLILIGHDDQRVWLESFAKDLMKVDDSGPNAAQYISGFGVHWYASVNDHINEFGYLTSTHNAYPDKFILATEACAGYLPWEGKPILGDWSRGELYSYDIIGDLENWASGWVDWNLVLDTQGGPNHAKNFVDAPIIVDTKSGTRYWKQPMFYHMAHFSKFIPPQSVRMRAVVHSTLLQSLESTVWKTPDGNFAVVVLLNRNSFFDIPYRITIGKLNAYFAGDIPKKSIQTIVIPLSTAQ